jgi:hypothetical protein
MPGLHSRKTLCQSNTKFPFKTVYFLGVRGLTTSSYIVYNNSTKELPVILSVLSQIEHKILQANLIMAFVNNLFAFFKMAY